MERTADRKLTPLARWEKGASRWKPVVSNTIGTLAGITCPGKTEWCIKCYAGRTEKFYPKCHALVERNTLALEVASSIEQKIQLYEKAVLDFKEDHERAQKRVPWSLPKVFRWFWDGDIRTKEDARAIRAVCVKHPEVQFWQYTRSFEFVPFLLGPNNLVVYLSVDRYNLEQVRILHGGDFDDKLKYAFCGDSWEETEELSRSLIGRNCPRCPELTKKIPLVVDKGNGYGIGACVECMMCIKGVNSVRFSSKH